MAHALATDMFKAIVTASVSVLILTIASAASAAIGSCEETANTNYAIAIAIDAPDADMVYENTMSDCGGWEAPYASPLSYSEALIEAERIGALGIERFPGTVDGWIPIAGDTEADADEILAGPLSMLTR